MNQMDVCRSATVSVWLRRIEFVLVSSPFQLKLNGYVHDGRYLFWPLPIITPV